MISAHQLPMQMNTTYLHRGVEILLAEESDKHAQIRSTAQEPTPKLSDNSISATSSCMKIQKKKQVPNISQPSPSSSPTTTTNAKSRPLSSLFQMDKLPQNRGDQLKRAKS